MTAPVHRVRRRTRAENAVIGLMVGASHRSKYPRAHPIGSYVRLLEPTGRHAEAPSPVGEVMSALWLPNQHTWAYSVRVIAHGTQQYPANQVEAV